MSDLNMINSNIASPFMLRFMDAIRKTQPNVATPLQFWKGSNSLNRTNWGKCTVLVLNRLALMVQAITPVFSLSGYSVDPKICNFYQSDFISNFLNPVWRQIFNISTLPQVSIQFCKCICEAGNLLNFICLLSMGYRGGKERYYRFHEGSLIHL